VASPAPARVPAAAAAAAAAAVAVSHAVAVAAPAPARVPAAAAAAAAAVSHAVAVAAAPLPVSVDVDPAEPSAEVVAQLQDEARRRVPFRYARPFDGKADRASPPFVAAHVAPMSIVAGAGGSWWQAANKSATGTLTWRKIATLPPDLPFLIDQSIQDRNGTTRQMTIALEAPLSPAH
jgi:hypothetical protein